jgi:hypothetical protein
VPKATTIALLVSPNTPETVSERRDVQAAAKGTGSNSSFLMPAVSANTVVIAAPIFLDE